MRQLKISKKVTTRDSPSFDKYLLEIGRKDLISPEEEIELARRIKEGDQKALDKLVTSNLRFVVSVAKQYQNQGLSLQDLVNEGNLGLIKAAKRFDETRGFKFISYAVWWIRQSILHSLAIQGRLVRLPLNKIGAINKIHMATSKLEQELNREPTEEEIAEIMEFNANDIKENLRNSTRHLSMDAPLSKDDDDATLYDVIGMNDSVPPDNSLMLESLRKEINSTLSVLAKREAQIIKLFYGLEGQHPKTLEEIAEEFGLTRERVRQIRESAIRRLKQSNKYKKLKSYLV
ncbi:MAG TPA: RNA polymerase sigma factor RpoD/SigA [Bacteroidales bacterium]|nr:RNA polymerase sigma factor RpoD/SigA [Bacteroidales bacterium]MDD4235672.1 RNA polymerase sigma factor RpoD/SigA [Bacteroidales bacterium]MDY0161005.1 RNA polymerase sigma factor RpoD/SigA [Bacteroidales bacterium]HXK80902.1 RNA polymerase sigma factor RpoD/SigA [Bacteroidales bacterium]